MTERDSDMNLPYPHFQTNFKIYPGTWGADALEFDPDLLIGPLVRGLVRPRDTNTAA